MKQRELDGIKVGHIDDLPEGRVKSVTARTHSICLSHFQGQWAAMDSRCPHQGGPLGEGWIERGIDGKWWIRCKPGAYLTIAGPRATSLSTGPELVGCNPT